MNIKAIITEEYTMFNGTLTEKLTGLSLYIQALRKTKVPDELINDAIKYGFMSEKDLEIEDFIVKHTLKKLIIKADINYRSKINDSNPQKWVVEYYSTVNDIDIEIKQ